MDDRKRLVVFASAALLVVVLIFGMQNYLARGSNVLMGLAPQVSQIQLHQNQSDSTLNSSQLASTEVGNSSYGTGPSGNSDLTAIFEKVNASVVQITSKVSTKVPNIIINGNPLEGESTRLGSGFVYDYSGHIITNDHVVNGAGTVDVTFIDGNTYTAKIVGRDEFADIAVLVITDDNFNANEEQVAPLAIGDSSKLRVGEQVVAIGNPFGLSDTMTTGIVSQVGRLLPNQNSGFSIPDVIQTDAAINPGNSGGPLLNLDSEVIGVNSAIRSNTGEFSGVGFAIPSNTIKRIVPALIENGTYEHPWLGISGTNLTPDLAESLGMPRDSKGVIVTDVVKNGPADSAGIRGAARTSDKPDVIVAVDGNSVRSLDDVILYVEEHKMVGDDAVLTILRANQHIDLKITLQARPAPSA